MIKEINLLSFKRAISPREKKIHFWLQVVSLGVLGIYAFVLSTFSSYWFFLKNRSEKVEEKIEELEQQIGAYQEQESLYRKLVAKLQDISDLVELRPDFIKILTDLEKLGGEGVDFETIHAEKGGVVEFEGKAEETVFLDDLARRVLDDEDYQEATFTGVTRGEDGTIDFSLKGKRSFLP